MRVVSVASIAALILPILSSHASAAYVITISQESTPITSQNFLGLNVVASGMGSLDISGLTLGIENDYVHNDQIYAPTAFIDIGNTSFTTYIGASGPSSFGHSCGCSIAFASSASGSAVGVSDTRSHLLGIDLPREIFVPRGYVSGTNLGVSSFIALNESYADLGLVPGTYVYSWSSDTLTVDVMAPLATPGLPSPVPLPDSAPMLGAALLGLTCLSYSAKRKRVVAMP